MRKITFLVFTALICSSVVFASTEPDTLVHWDFHRWAGGGAAGVPSDLTISTPIPGDYGLQATTVSIGSENMFVDGEGGTVRNWGTPSSAGYVRTAAMVPDTYYRVVGLTSSGFKTIKVKAGFAADSSSRYYYMQLQFRLGTTGSWIAVGDPVFVNVVSENAIPVRFDDVELPSLADNATSLEIRFLVTSLDGVATTTQSRMDNVIITALRVQTSLSKNESSLSVSTVNNSILITGGDNQSASVYTLSGVLLSHIRSLSSTTSIEMPGKGIYILKTGSEIFKIIL